MNSRIDILCVCEQLKPCVESCDHVITPCPDHKAVVLCVRGDERPRGRGYWKLNVSVLDEENYKESIRKIISDTLSEYRHQVEKAVIWELVKIRVKEYSIRYCCLRNKKQKNEIKLLENSINDLDKKIHNCCESAQIITEMVLERRNLKEQLDVLYQNKAIGAQIRSKVRFVEEGERSTEYFLAVEKHRQNNNCIKALRYKGITYSEDDEILDVASKFYAELYTGKTQGVDAINEYLDKVNLPELSPERQNSCEGLISQQECEDALKKIKTNKSPGDDGIPIEFYKAFWNEIGSLLVDVYNESFENKILPLSMRKSVITLIHKREDKTKIENYRPISLTNTDYRILACVLASRLQRVINDIVGPDQTAYIKGRFIGSNVRLVQDLFDLYNKKKLSGLFMFVDLKKLLTVLNGLFSLGL